MSLGKDQVVGGIWSGFQRGVSFACGIEHRRLCRRVSCIFLCGSEEDGGLSPRFLLWMKGGVIKTDYR